MLASVREGLSDGEVALRRGCGVETVRFHLRNIRAKLGLHTRQALRDWPGRPAISLAAEVTQQDAWSVREQIPLVVARDMAKMLDFYTQVLSMQLVARYPDPPGLPGWCALASGAARIMLHHGHHRREVTAVRGPSDITLSLYVTGLDLLHDELVQRGCRPSHIEVMPYGAREFYVNDPEGHELAFVEFTASDPGYTTEPHHTEEAHG